jgi:hypothetical protein
LTVAVREPSAVGVKVTEIEQVDPAASVVPQVVVFAKSPEFIPPTAMLEMFSTPVPVLLNVTLFAAVVEPMVVES